MTRHLGVQDPTSSGLSLPTLSRLSDLLRTLEQLDPSLAKDLDDWQTVTDRFDAVESGHMTLGLLTDEEHRAILLEGTSVACVDQRV